MLVTPLNVLLTKPQKQHWDDLLAHWRAVEATESEDPWVFHGTSCLRAGWIERDGFDPSHIGEAGPGVHWGSVNIAECFALRHIRYDDPPALLAARLSDVLASGIAVPDMAAVEQPMGEPFAVPFREWIEGTEITSWNDTYELLGAFGILGGRHVANLRVLALPNFPLHPEAVEARIERLDDLAKGGFLADITVAVPPGLEYPDHPDIADSSNIVQWHIDFPGNVAVEIESESPKFG